MTATTASLTEFLLARIAEDEADAHAQPAITPWPDHDLGECDECDRRREHRDAEDARYDRVLAECEAKRRIVEQLQRHERLVRANVEKHAEVSRGGLDNQEQITALRTHGWELSGRLEALRMAVDALAAVYADHPEFRPEWRP